MLNFVMLMAIAFILECVDNALGGGFGTILSPFLILFGYDPKAVVPAILFSELVSGFWGGMWHTKYNNVNYRAVGATLVGSLTGTAAATIMIGRVLPDAMIKQLIALITVITGIVVIIRSYSLIARTKTKKEISASKTILLGLVVGFNKAGSGGGYGPLSVSGYILLGLAPAVAVGTTTVAEGVACAFGLALYSQMIGITLPLAAPIAIGAFIADPISAWANNKLKEKLKPPFHGRYIGMGMTALGLLTLLKTLSR